MSPHTCHAHNCTTPVFPRMFMCRPHWFSLPKAMRDAVLDAYTPGQERNWDRIKDEYFDAAFAAEDFIAAKETP